MTQKMKQGLGKIFYISIIAVAAFGGILMAYILQRNPVVQNAITSALPSHSQGVNPDANISAPKEGNDKGKLLTKTFDKTYDKPEITKEINGLHPANQRIPPKYEVDHYIVTFNTTDENNKLLAITGQLYVPKVTEAESFPIYVFGSGTTGIDDQCAPSKEITSIDNWGAYNAHMLSYASQGYIVFFPDYEGFNDIGRLHHYFNGPLEGRLMLDGARATYDFFAKEESVAEPAKAVFFTGYSQGGHAAFAAKDIAQDYAPEIPIKGIIGYAPTTNIQALLRENPHLSPYLVVAYKDFYGDEIVQPDKIFQQKWLSSLETDATSKCISDVIKYYPASQQQMYTPEFIQALNNRFKNSFQSLGKVLDENDTGYVGNDIPAVVIQGGADPIVTNKTQEEFVTESCEAGNKIEYKNYPGVHHFQTRQVSFLFSLQWMKDRLENKDLNSKCEV